MTWSKEGRIFDPDGYRSEWMNSHAAVPVAEQIRGDRYRVYFSPRDGNNRSQIAFFEFSVNNPSRILEVSRRPVFTHGSLGSFDVAGVMTSWLVNLPEEKRMYYIGWNLGVDVPFRNALGLAVSSDNGKTFQRYFEGPILDRSPVDPAFVASACVFHERGEWRMWYLSGLAWTRGRDGFQPRYHIKYAQSENGISWERTGHVCIDFQDKAEYAISRPCVIKEKGIYRMWYSYRGASYRIGYAESNDGLAWVRKDNEAGIDVSSSGWDSEMIEYPFVFQHEKTKIMLYNGNGYGKTGIGYAVLYE